MTRHHIIAMLLLCGGATIIAGCGVSHTPIASAAPKQSPNTGHTQGVPSSSAHGAPESSTPPTPTAATPSSGASTASSAFAPVIIGAMQAIVGHTQVPLYARRKIEDFAPAPYYSAVGHVSSETQPASSYSLTFYRTSSAIPPNSPKLATLSPLDVIGRYEVSAWANAETASQHLFYGTAPTPPVPPQKASGAPVTLETGLIGVRTALDGLPAVVWHEGRWTMAVTYEHVPYTTALATVQGIVRFCQQHMLPPPTIQGYGIVMVDGSQTGTHLSWSSGTTVISTSDSQGWRGAFESTLNTHPFP